MSKLTIFIFILLLSSVISSAARSYPAHRTTQHQGDEAKSAEAAADESCNEPDEEECLMRRTLVAHLDYIYTQSHNKP